MPATLARAKTIDHGAEVQFDDDGLLPNRLHFDNELAAEELGDVATEEVDDDDLLHKNAKLTDAEVVEMRTLRARSVAANDPIPWDNLGHRFHDIHWKTCYRICTGLSRPKLGGPLEPIVPSTANHETVRCRGCGGRHLQTEICTLCNCRWSEAIIRIFSLAGLVKASDF